MRILNLLLFSVVAIALLCVPQVANASISIVPGDWVVISENNAVRYGDGGEFQVTVYQPGSFDLNTGAAIGTPVPISGSNPFFTFCAATTQVFVPDHAYEVTGATNYFSFPNPPDFATKLYNAYATNTSTDLGGTLNGNLVTVTSTAYVPGHAALVAMAGNSWTNGSITMSATDVAGAIQEAMWLALGDVNPPQTLYNEAVTLFGWSSANLPSLALGDYLESMTLYGPANNYSYGGPGQPQFLMVGPDFGPPIVPEPCTLAIWSVLGAGGLLGLRTSRKRRVPVGRQPWSPENRQAIHEIIAGR